MKKKRPKKLTAYRLEKVVVDQIDAIGKRTGMNRTQVVEAAILAYANDMETVESPLPADVTKDLQKSIYRQLQLSAKLLAGGNPNYRQQGTRKSDV